VSKKLHPLVEKAINKGSIIEDSWMGFAIKVIPKDSPRNQFTEMRKAYYCGFYAAFSLMYEVSNTIGEDDEDGTAKILENIKDKCEEEIKKFMKF